MARIPFCLVLVGFCACGGGRTPIEPGDPISTLPPGWATGGYVAPTGGNWNTGGLRATGGYGLTGGMPASGGLIRTGGVRTGGFFFTGGAPSTGGLIPTGGARSGGLPLTGGTPFQGGRPVTGGLPGTGGIRSGGLPASGGIRTGGAPLTGGLPASGGIRTGGLPTTGGLPASGGFPTTGGLPASGGFFATGGLPASGGFFATGGLPATGGFPRSGGALAICGNGVLEPGETCDLGPATGTRPALLVTQNTTTFTVSPVVRVASATDFYNPISYSAHTGFEAANTSRIFLYLDKSSNDFSVFFIHNIDGSTSGLNVGPGRVSMRISGLPSTTSVAVSDNPNELTMSSATSALGDWSFGNNTDGGVLSGLPFPGSWEVMVSPAFLQGITAWTWVQGDGSFTDLAMDQPLVIKAYEAPGLCRSDCTVPRCGDGILDGGERCDDGNTMAGDRCDPDCQSIP